MNTNYYVNAVHQQSMETREREHERKRGHKRKRKKDGQLAQNLEGLLSETEEEQLEKQILSEFYEERLVQILEEPPSETDEKRLAQIEEERQDKIVKELLAQMNEKQLAQIEEELQCLLQLCVNDRCAVCKQFFQKRAMLMESIRRRFYGLQMTYGQLFGDSVELLYDYTGPLLKLEDEFVKELYCKINKNVRKWYSNRLFFINNKIDQLCSEKNNLIPIPIQIPIELYETHLYKKSFGHIGIYCMYMQQEIDARTVVYNQKRKEAEWKERCEKLKKKRVCFCLTHTQMT